MNGRATPYDDHGHGTHVSSTAAGTGAGTPYVGVAPGASLIGIKVLNAGGSGSESVIVDGIQWAIDNKDALGIDVISMSLGASINGDGTSPMELAVTQAMHDGIVTVVAAGNSGPGPNTVGIPASAFDIITVGAIDDAKEIASFSSRGPTADGRLKPEVAAPGVDIMAAAANTGSGYASHSGTSMATPHVSGLAALMIERGGHSISTDDVRQVMMDTAEDRGESGPDNTYGAGVVDAVSAVGGSIAQEHDVAIRSVTAPRHLDPNETATINVTVRNNGLANETDVTVRLLSNGELIGAVTLAELPSHTSTIVPFGFTAPPTEGTYTITGEATPVANETVLGNNARNATIRVLQSDGTIRVAVFDSPGVDFASYFGWRTLEDNWFDYGRTLYQIDTTSLNHDGITLDDLHATGADIIAIPDACCGWTQWKLSVAETDALNEYVQEGHGLWGSQATLSRDMPSNAALEPLFGLTGAHNASRCTSFDATISFVDPSGTFARNLGASYSTGMTCGTFGLSATTATLEAQSVDGTASVWSHKSNVTAAGAAAYATWNVEVTGFGANHDDLQLVANAFTWLKANAAPYPTDLGAARLSVPTFAFHGDTYHVSAVIHNYGTETSPETTTTLLRDGAVIASWTIPTLSSLGAYPIDVDVAASDVGRITLELVVDAVPGEASTANNHASRTVRVADEAVLLLQEADPWGTTANEDALNALGIPYLKAGREAFSMDFSRFYKLVLASDQTYDFYNALAENESVLTTYVEDGGTLELHAADYGWNGGTWDRLPGGFTHIMDCIDNVRIMEPSHPLFTTPNAIDEASLQDWWCSSHGALSAMPDATSSLIESGGVPVAVESYLGTGTIVLTLQPVELSYTYWAHPMILNLLAYRPTREATDGAMARLIAPKHVAPDQEVTINVVVANAGTTNMPPTDVALFVEGSATQHALTGVLAPNAVARLDFVVSFTTMGAHRVEASLAAQSGESNLANNARNATIQVRPPGPIAAVDLGTPEGTGVLDAVGIPSCDIDASGLCYDLLTPSDLRAENFAGRRTLYVGWTDGANSDAIAALRERAADIATFVSSGGGLVAWSEPYLGYDDWIPEGASVQLLYTGGDSVVLTDAGAAHPALAGQTNESLSNWGNSYHHAFQAWPSYLGILAVTGAGEALTLAGSYGDGCVLVTGQDPDWHGHYTRQPGALMMANATLHWASACTGAPPTLPDLAVSSVTATPNPANVDDPVTIGAVIENRGNATATDATVRFYVDDDSVADILILTLPPGSAQRVNVTWRAAAGNHTVSVVADPDGSIPESNESNNKGLSPKVLVVTALTPDLVVINVTATPRDPVPGTFITVKALIRNEGSGKAPTGFDVALAVDGDVVATQHFPPGMPAGYVLNVTMGTSLAEGTHELTIIADVNNDVKESDESNNDRSIYLDVVDRPLPDLAVRILGVEKASIQTDYAVVGPNPIGAERVIIQACNAGAGPLTNAIVQVSVEVRDPRDSTSSRDVGTTSVGTLKAGECTVVEQRWVPNAIGDVRFIANGITPDIESTMRNNVDTLDGFVVIGGFGGVLLPLP